jgi:peptide chain release factor
MAGLELDAALVALMKKAGVKEDDLVESFTRGTGPGGQKINKTSSTVQLVHTPTSTEIRCQRERSQSANRYWARWELCEGLLAVKAALKLEIKNATEKKRRQARPRPRALQEKILKTKRKRSEVKKQRGRVTE